MKHKFVVTGVLGGIVALLAVWFASPSFDVAAEPSRVAREPNISPDYRGVTIPGNIAPMNFRILETGQTYCVRIHSAAGRPIELASRTGRISIPLRKWRDLLEASRGHELFIDVYVRNAANQWLQFKSIVNTVADEDIDRTLVYRFMRPVYNAWKKMGIYQRDLIDFDVSLVMDGRSFGEGCLNCHSFAGNTCDTMTIGLRSPIYGSSTLLARKGEVHKIGAKWGYTAWHPSGRLAVYSINKVRQFFHTAGLEVRDVVDLDSALLCYHVDSRKVSSPGGLADKSRLETYPTWSPDGRYLYFCSGPVLWEDRNTVPPVNYDKLKYDLCRISYDVETDQWGKAETVLSADETGLSILLPRVSPDGRFLLFCMCKYGCFPVYQPSSDLYMMDLARASADARRESVLSDATETV